MKAVLRVLDAYSLIAYLEGEKGADTMVEAFKSARDSGKSLLLSVVNWGEVYHIILREEGRRRVDEISHLISTLPIEIVPADSGITRQAAEYKAVKKMSYADCFAAALAKLHRAELVTGDIEFKQVEGDIKIRWI
ncbi:MAG TPA: type II toxin-antitoxin system VapC family toxin [Syntrophorhabdaceae bacterium]|nr:type II toxin-antitoxin system VapC family toxin [Syntrophorhabdaceae bacterium]HNT68310.1 type II toxin-antitoxin system VapC family toxin [Syntrophorhabdaceae bacterium]